MRRIVSACLHQTMRFESVNDSDPMAEFQMYQEKLRKSGVKFSVVETKNEENGSLIVKIERQHNSYSTDGYL